MSLSSGSDVKSKVGATCGGACCAGKRAFVAVVAVVVDVIALVVKTVVAAAAGGPAVGGSSGGCGIPTNVGVVATGPFSCVASAEVSVGLVAAAVGGSTAVAATAALTAMAAATVGGSQPRCSQLLPIPGWPRCSRLWALALARRVVAPRKCCCWRARRLGERGDTAAAIRSVGAAAATPGGGERRLERSSNFTVDHVSLRKPMQQRTSRHGVGQKEFLHAVTAELALMDARTKMRESGTPENSNGLERSHQVAKSS